MVYDGLSTLIQLINRTAMTYRYNTRSIQSHNLHTSHVQDNIPPVTAFLCK